MKTSAKNTEELGKIIKTKRKELQVTQKELALTCGTGIRFIIDLEKGKPTCQISKILQIINALGLQMQIIPSGNDLFDGEQG